MREQSHGLCHVTPLCEKAIKITLYRRFPPPHEWQRRHRQLSG